MLPLFGLSIATTGFDITERGRMQNVVQSLGGTYMPTMKRNVTTHLIASRPDGDKYDTALQWRSMPPAPGGVRIHLVGPLCGLLIEGVGVVRSHYCNVSSLPRIG